MWKFANRSPFGTSQRIAYGISSVPSPSPSPGGGAGDLLQLLADQPERGGTDLDGVPLGQRRVRDALPIDESAVTAVQVHDAAFARHVAQLGVLAGGGGVGDHDVVLRCPADAHRRGGPWPRRPGLAIRLWLRPGRGGRALPVRRADHLAGRGPAWRARSVSAD